MQAAHAAILNQRGNIEGLVKVTAFDFFPEKEDPQKEHADILCFPSGTQNENFIAIVPH